MTNRIISAYTPSNTDPQTRERIFVQRHKLLNRVVRWCEESVLTGNKHHLLFVGPRGSGKTHLVAMARDRLFQNPQLTDKMRIAWLGEDNVFTGLIDVALEIADELANEYPDEFSFDYRTHAKPLAADEAAEAILDEVIRRLGDKSILLIMENLDRAFHGLRDLGQKKWRAFLQENGRIATLATSQQLFDGISSRDAAFYGFFEIIHLEPLSVEDARRLMANIARENNNTKLVQFMATSEGRYRVRALHHLAGGNHRMYVMLSEFVTKESLDGLVAAFEELAEDLTPYFQERLRSLSPQQARIVQSLCNSSGAMTVKEVAEDTFIADRNASKQLGELKRKGYVISERRGKESYYEMAEPLMRLCLEVKKQRGKPLTLVAAFLRAWYSVNSVQVELEIPSHIPSEDPRMIAYKNVALQSDDVFHQAISQKLHLEFESKIKCKEFADALNIAEELEYSDRPTGLTRKSRVFSEQGRFAEALKEDNKVLSLTDLTASQQAKALLFRGVTYRKLGESERVIADCSAVIEMTEAPVALKAGALFHRGVTYEQLGESEKAIADCTAVIEMTDAPVAKAIALDYRGFTYGHLGEFEKAIADYSAVIETTDAPVEQKSRALFHRGDTYGQLGESEKAIADYSAVIEMTDAPVEHKSRALCHRGDTYGQLGESEKAIADCSAAIEMTDAPDEHKSRALLDRVVRYVELGEFEKAIADYSAVIELTAPPVDAMALIGRSSIYCILGEPEKAIADCSTVIEITEAGVEQKVSALVNRGRTYGQLGAFGKAIADYSAVIEMTDIPVEQKARALVYRGDTYRQLGESEKTIADHSAVIEMTEASVDQKANALVCRGLAHGQLGEIEKATADYSAVIEMPEAPIDQLCWALMHRGLNYHQHGESEKAIADCSAVIEMTDAPVNIKAVAMNQRGVIYWHSNQFDLALNEFTSLARMTGVSSSSRTIALFCIPEAMIPTKPVQESIASIQRAFNEGDSKTSGYGGSPRDILKMIIGREHSSWSGFVEKLVPIYAEYDALSALGSGLTESIAVLDAGGFSRSQLDLWNSAWQRAGAEYDELSIPLAALDASVQVIKTGNDRPLFALPLEIRKIIQPLLKNSLSES